LEKGYRKTIKLMEENTIGRRIQQARVKKNLTQKQLAELVGKSQRAISHFESEVHEPSASDVMALSLALDIPILYFFGGNAETQSSILEQSLLEEFRKLPSIDAKRAIIEVVRSVRSAIESNS
jgi:transcriptional regulator with XRE-family HTH domain